MKVGILTFPHSPSIGAMLQMRSLYHIVEALGHEAEIINYVSDKVNHQKKQKRTSKSVAISVISSIFLKSPSKSYSDFESALKMFPEFPSCSLEHLKAIENRFDKIIVGSDQVWNPVVTGHDFNFYLAFCKNSSKKISYAASFGYSSISEEGQKAVKAELEKFNNISVREQTGVDIVKKLTGRNATLVLDPTLLVQSDYLRSLLKPAKRNNKFVLFFCIKPSASLYQKAALYAQKYGLELVTVGGRIVDYFNPSRHPAFGVGPSEFLGLVDEAECIFTNSFHGTAISIALHREFFVEFSSDTNSRLDNLTKILGLEERVIRNEELVPKKINYNDVDKKLEHYRKISCDFLNNALTE